MADHTLSYDRQLDCVHVTFTGIVDLRVIQEVAPQVARLCAETGCHRILNDMSRAHIDISLLETFQSPAIMDQALISRSIRRALIPPPDFPESQFLETISQNRGHNLKVFSSVADATAWLTKEP